MILKNISVLYGNDLKFIEKTSVEVTGNTIQKISSKIKPSKNKVVNCNGLLLIPGLINSHTHIGDSVAKDIALNKDVDSKIHPMFGVKQKILRETEPKKLILFMRKTAKSMLKKGITTRDILQWNLSILSPNKNHHTFGRFCRDQNEYVPTNSMHE